MIREVLICFLTCLMMLLCITSCRRVGGRDSEEDTTTEFLPEQYLNPNATCDGSSGVTVCTCNEGYVGDGVVCWEQHDATQNSGDGATDAEEDESTDGNNGSGALITKSVDAFHLVQVTGGYRYSCGLRLDGTAVCWGDNYYGQSALPTDVQFQSVSAGMYHVCGLRLDGGVNCVGWNEFGQASPPSDEVFVEITSGRQVTCGLRANGTVRCWGSFSGEDEKTFKQIDAMANGVCGIKTDDSLYCWPAATHAEINSYFAGDKYMQVAATEMNICGLLRDGTVKCVHPPDNSTWNPFGDEYALPSENVKFSAIAVDDLELCGITANGETLCARITDQRKYRSVAPSPGTGFVRLSAGTNHTCGLQSDGLTECWGDNFSGEASPPDSEVRVQISWGSNYKCSLLADGTVRGWGSHKSPSYLPPEGVTFKQIAAGEHSACGLKNNGELLCWGDVTSSNEDPHLHDGEIFSEISTTGCNPCGIYPDGVAQCWGSYKKLTRPPEGITFRSISSCEDNNCGITSDGATLCWGDDATTPDFSPSEITLTQIGTAARQACGLTETGTAVCWGENQFGDRLTPPNDVQFSQLTFFKNGACGLQHNGLVRCWGPDPEAMAPPAGVRFAQIEASDATMCGIRADTGTEMCWGNTIWNPLGDR